LDLLEAIIVGIVQGATEFLPVSSSGHVVLVPWWLGLDTPPLIYTVTVHLATTVAVLIYFWRDWFILLQAGIKALRTRSFNLKENPEFRILVLILIGTIPAGIIGLLFADQFEELFSTPAIVSFNLFITAALLSYSEWNFRKRLADTRNAVGDAAEELTPPVSESSEAEREAMKSLKIFDTVFIGFGQALAIMPGISRSGSTIATGLFRGLDRAAATRYSFLLATPIIIAAAAKQFLDVLTGEATLEDDMAGALVAGFIASFVVGYLSIAFMLRFVRRRGLYGFAIYCVAFGLLSLGAIIVRG
jgi:undecaprenyl-diphosphatase